ncbi:hypothetical protein KSP35_09395 [Aquihabitans sp. G128]|uniref:glycosyl hydrolase n=1 Tax=Aquihabitans sp. G128 TaxID=2849779 RepID=UPI001C24F2FF|nr:glycosyl hydrolase [Aquihabitans sp. G128]QXC62972.1 hypothetical protein KSP35_09395 [Aquihabitans sp. G128]
MARNRLVALDTNRVVLAVAVGIVLAVVVGLVVVRPLLRRSPGVPVPRPSGASRTPTADRADRRVAPVVDGHALQPVADVDRPPVASQWGGAADGIPSGTWWSAAVTGPGAASLWPQPLGLVIDEHGLVQVAAPPGRSTADGGVEAPLVPAVFLDLGADATTEVVGHGPLHVTLALVAGGRRVEVTLVQGSPAVELRATGPFDLRAPGLDLAPGASVDGRALAFGTSEGRWALGSDDAAVEVRPDVLHVVPGPSGRVAFGPVLAGADDGYAARLATLAAHPLTATEEDLAVAADGTTTQTLTQVRAGTAEGAVSLWALQPHHQRYAKAPGPVLGTVSSVQGTLPVVAADRLRLTYPPAPVLWSAVPLPGAADPVGIDQAAPSEGVGSYFGGKSAYSAAARAGALRAAGDDAGSTAALADAEKRLDDLVDPGRPPSVRWDDRWGSAVLAPAEFGAGTELNDHQLQYGYWIAAASHVVEADPSRIDAYRETIDLLIADFAGSATVAGAPKALADLRSWSPYEGHSWASGTARFGAGNNLESNSEAAFAWWAAARWMVATGRADAAEPFVARFTVESALGGTAWLPDGDLLPADPATRPWSGVVWSGKVDPNTWFDPADESALGIRLLPLGPAALARYRSTTQVDGARARWSWCADHGDGCRARWANLLDSDAVVAGLPPQSGPDPEPSTTPLLAAWWRDLWERTTPADGWTCSIGAVARRSADGSVVVLASNPGPAAVDLSCRDGAGVERWSASVHGTTSAVVRTSG